MEKELTSPAMKKIKMAICSSSHHEDQKNGDEREELMDRFSALPDSVIHHIFTFVTSTQDLTRVSILSQRFFSLWRSFPVIDFNQNMFRKTEGTLGMLYSDDEFLDHIHHSISIRQFQNVQDLKKFRIVFNSDRLLHVIKELESDDRLNDAIHFAIKNNAKHFEIDLLGFRRYQLPPFFASNSINVLKLSGFVLDANLVFQACPKMESLCLSCCTMKNDEIRLASIHLKGVEFHNCDRFESIDMETPNLETFSFIGLGGLTHHSYEINISSCVSLVVLSISNAKITDSWFEDIIPQFLHLHTLIVSECRYLENVKVRHKNLIKFDLWGCILLKELEIATPSLQSLSFRGFKLLRCVIHIRDCNAIKELSIKSAYITNEWLRCQISTMLDLEYLKLGSCYELDMVDISHKGLQRLELLDCYKLVEVNVNAPELVCFSFRGKPTHFGLMISRSVGSATISLTQYTVMTSNHWFHQLRDMLSFFSHLGTLTLICESGKSCHELRIPESVRDILISPLCDLKHLKIQTGSSITVDSDLVDSLLWFAPHLETLCFISIDKVMRFEYVQMMEGHNDIYCCRGRAIKCWRHYLKKVEMQNFDESGTEVGLVKYFEENGMILERICYNSNSFSPT